ncbi:MAG: O-antigen polysaccharide polymerase Wzy [Paludibacteraceae bacterium]|nr:O-antigen polysaccharide polymerase Wzy [Paludibacteraceae bacterium]
MTKKRFAQLMVSLVLLAASLFLIWLKELTDQEYAVMMCTHFIWLLYLLWDAERFTPFLTFTITFTLLFIGGRFWAVFFSPDEFELRRGNFFRWEDIPLDIWQPSLTYILLFLYLSSWVYIFRMEKKAPGPVLSYEGTASTPVDIWLRAIFFILAGFTLYDVFDKLHTALSGGGYLSLYLEQTEKVAAGSGLIASLLYVFFGIALVYGNKTTKRLYLFLIFIKAFVFILIGQRAKFGALLLFFLWYHFRNRNVRLFRIAIGGGASLVALMWIASLSIREAADEDIFTPLELLSQFFMSQGVSLSTFTFSQEVTDYPVLPYFVSFIPGVASLYSLFTPLPAAQAAFANYLAYSLNPGLFEGGHGLGWTLLSDLYLYSGRTYLGFALLSALFGYCCACMEDKSRTSPLAATIVFAVFLNLAFLPRSGLYTIIPLMVWIVLVHYLFIECTGFKTYYNLSDTTVTEKKEDIE